MVDDPIHHSERLLPISFGRFAIERRVRIDLLMAQRPHHFYGPLAKRDRKGANRLTDAACVQLLPLHDELAGHGDADGAADIADGGK